MRVSLADLAFDEAINAFENSPFCVEECLNKRLADKFFSKLSTQISPSVSAVYINQDDYFKRALRDAGKSTGIRAADDFMSYKQLFFELYIQDVVDQCSNERELLKEIRSFSDFIFTLSLSIPYEFPITTLCSNLPNLTRLELKFTGKIQDMPNNAFASLSSLVSLVLKNNQITDKDTASIFDTRFEQCNISHLDLSHNQISCAGTDSVVKRFISSPSSLSFLDLSGNKLCDKCAAILGSALVGNESLMSLNLSLNSIGDTGGVTLFEGVKQNNVLRSINMSANKLGSKTARIISEVLRDDGSMDCVIVVSNLFSHDELEMLRQFDSCSVGPLVASSLPPTNTIDCLASEVPSSN